MSYLKNLIDAKHTSIQMRKIVRYVGKDQTRFDELIKITLGKEKILAQRASWPTGYCVESYPELARKHLRLIINHLTTKTHPAVQRNLAKLLMFVDLPEKLESLVVDKCYLIINSNDAPIANRAYSAYVVEKICRKYPEMYPELIQSLKAHSEVASPGMNAVLRKIQKFQQKFTGNKKELPFL